MKSAMQFLFCSFQLDRHSDLIPGVAQENQPSAHPVHADGAGLSPWCGFCSDIPSIYAAKSNRASSTSLSNTARLAISSCPPGLVRSCSLLNFCLSPPNPVARWGQSLLPLREGQPCPLSMAGRQDTRVPRCVAHWARQLAASLQKGFTI